MKIFSKNNSGVFHSIVKLIIYLWKKYYRLIFIFSLLASLGVACYFWYVDVYKFQWSEERKTEYLNAKGRSVDLREESFMDVLKRIDERRERYEKDVPSPENIFKHY